MTTAPYRVTGIQFQPVRFHNACLLAFFFIFLGILVTFSSSINAGEIHVAVRSGDIDKVKKLLAGNPKLVNQVDETEKFTPLHAAAQYHQNEIVKLLIAKGADVNAKNWYKTTPLDSALVRFGIGRETVRLLEKNGGKSALYTELHIAVLTGDKERAKRLLVEKPENLEARDGYGWTPLLDLITFAPAGSMMKDLDLEQRKRLEQGLDMPWEKIQTLAAEYQEMLDLLLSQGADVNAKGEHGITALHLASRSEQLVQILLDHGARIDAKDELGMTPLCNLVSGMFGRPTKRMIEKFLAKGADVSVRAKLERNLLHWLCAGSWDLGELAELLIKKRRQDKRQR